jgi:uncharacterized phage infection (PIP) family protein YhgE
MSEDTTKNLEEKYSTKPTIETVLDSINSLGQTINARIDGLETNLNARIDRVETSLNTRINGLETNLNTRIEGLETSLYDLRANFNVRLDRLERDIKLVHSMTFDLRADLTELRHQLKLPE